MTGQLLGAKTEKINTKLATDPHRQTQTEAEKDIHKKSVNYFCVLMNDAKFAKFFCMVDLENLRPVRLGISPQALRTQRKHFFSLRTLRPPRSSGRWYWGLERSPDGRISAMLRRAWKNTLSLSRLIPHQRDWDHPALREGLRG